ATVTGVPAAAVVPPAGCVPARVAAALGVGTAAAAVAVPGVAGTTPRFFVGVGLPAAPGRFVAVASAVAVRVPPAAGVTAPGVAVAAAPRPNGRRTPPIAVPVSAAYETIDASGQATIRKRISATPARVSRIPYYLLAVGRGAWERGSESVALRSSLFVLTLPRSHAPTPHAPRLTTAR